MRRISRTIVSATGLLAILFATIAPAADDSPASAPTDPNHGMEQLMRMANYLAGLKRFSVTQHSGYDVMQVSGQKIEFLESRNLVLARPEYFRIDVQRSNGESYQVAFDGKTITIFNPTTNLYASSKVKGDIDGAITHFVKDLRMRMPLAMLFVSNLPDELKKRVDEAMIVENMMLDGQSHVHLAVRLDSVDFQIWVPATGDPLPRRIVITYKFEEGQPQYWARFSDWNTSPKAPKSLFSLDVPKDADHIPFLAELPSKVPAKGEKK